MNDQEEMLDGDCQAGCVLEYLLIEAVLKRLCELYIEPKATNVSGKLLAE